MASIPFGVSTVHQKNVSSDGGGLSHALPRSHSPHNMRHHETYVRYHSTLYGRYKLLSHSYQRIIKMASIVWVALAATIFFISITFIVMIPLYTFILALLTILRMKWQTKQQRNHGSKNKHSWSGITTSLFQGEVFHTRHQPMIHSFKYPLYFSVVDLDEASELFGYDNVVCSETQQQKTQEHAVNSKEGTLWPLSTLMLLRDIDHMKNGEGLLKNNNSPNDNSDCNLSMKERISNILYERTNGKLDISSSIHCNNNDNNDSSSAETAKRRIVLVTHLMYYGYCFNPVSFFFILKRKQVGDAEEEIEAIVVEVSNTPWNEMSIYVLHPDSVDTVENTIYPPKNGGGSSTHRYKWRKNFHVSPFMTMDHDYDWKFYVDKDRIKVEANMIRRPEDEDDANINDSSSSTEERNEKKGVLYFTAGFDIQRGTIQPTSTYPLQLARVICRFPVYCFIIQLWIHYEAIKLLLKGVEFIPHPKGSETGASRAIAAVMKPVFRALDVIDGWLKNRSDCGTKSKTT